MCLTDTQIAAMSEAELIALRDVLDRVIPFAVEIERVGGHFAEPDARHRRGLHHPFQ